MSTPTPHKRHHRKPSSALTAGTTSTTSTTTLKKKVRDLRRLLNNPKTSLSLPADIRAENERALAAFEHELTQAQTAAREKSIAKKYHMVRFFERQKATRRLKKLQKEGGDVDARLVYEAELDLNYILYYPKREKYISIFKDAGTNCEKRDMIRKDVERRMKGEGLGGATMEMGEREEVVKRRRGRRGEREKKGERKLEVEDEFFEL